MLLSYKLSFSLTSTITNLEGFKEEFFLDRLLPILPPAPIIKTTFFSINFEIRFVSNLFCLLPNRSSKLTSLTSDCYFHLEFHSAMVLS